MQTSQKQQVQRENWQISCWLSGYRDCSVMYNSNVIILSILFYSSLHSILLLSPFCSIILSFQQNHFILLAEKSSSYGIIVVVHIEFLLLVVYTIVVLYSDC